MRFRKLAQETGVAVEVLLGIAGRLGLGNYSSPEEQLSKDAETRLRVEIRRTPAARLSNGKSAPRSEFLPKTARPLPFLPGERESQLQKRIEPSPKADKAKPAPKPALQPALSPKPLPKPALIPKPPSKEPAPKPDSPAVQTAELMLSVQRLESKVSELEAQKNVLSAENTRLLYSTGELGTRLARLLGELDFLKENQAQKEQEHQAAFLKLQQELAEAQQSKPVEFFRTVKQLLEERGLKGEDEFRQALTGLLQDKQDLWTRLLVQEEQLFKDLLQEKLLLLAEGDELIAGQLGILVARERSEGEPASALTAAFRRFNTCCLVYNVKNIVIVGGSPAYHRRLREGLDGRLKVRLIPGDKRGLIEPPQAELTVLWAGTILDHAVSERFSDGLLIPHRGLSRMLHMVADYIEGKQ
jgi:uncharacterized small protein (DUF1192 family)